jgi:DNA-directed RNA polymerase subunit M/transcription elongation factor TFIIS
LERQKESVAAIDKEEKILSSLMGESQVSKMHRETFYWMVQTRGVDEASIQFFRRAKCGARAFMKSRA